MYCTQCGKLLQLKNPAFCQYCGAKVNLPSEAFKNEERKITPKTVVRLKKFETPEIEKTHKDKWTTFFLCLFVGTFGIHRFYVGKIGTGILYLFTMGLCGIGWIVDMIRILRGTFTDKNGRHLCDL